MRAGTPGRDNWCLLLKYTDFFGHPQMLRIPFTEIRDRTRLRNFLDKYGVPEPTAPDKLLDSIQQAQPERIVRLVSRPGWYSNRFLLGDDTRGKGDEELMLDDTLDAHLARVGNQGSLDDWKTHIADRCATSSYLIFGLAIGFAAPLLQLTAVEGGVTAVESGGFHFWVRSTRGKTTVQRCVASIFGKGTRDGDGYLRSWKTTMTAIEETALGHCDLPLILDEMKLLHPDQSKAAQLASDVAYSIANGAVKARSVGFTGSIPPDAGHFRALIVSSGEVSLSAQASNGRLEGEAVRLIDIPVPRRRTGIFDRLQKGATARDSRRLADALEQAAATYYGEAGKVFIAKLVQDIGNNHDGLTQRLASSIERFLAKSGVDLEDPYEVRFAKRFALAYAAGLLAIKYSVVPWGQEIVYRSIRRVYRKARSRTIRPVNPVQMAVKKVLSEVQRADVVDIRRKSPPIDPKTAEKADVLLITHSDGSSLYALRPDFFKSIVGPRISPRKVAKYLDRRHMLIPRSKRLTEDSDTKTCRTQQVRIPGLNPKRGYYCLTEAAVVGKSSPKPKKP
jgi:putative DNA primase/helicase